jgi:hypothetical protein
VSRENFTAWKEERTLPQHIEYLTEDPQACSFDYAYALTTGTLRRRKGTADLVASARTEKRRKKEVQEVKEIIVKEQKKKTVYRYIFSSAFITEAVMVCVGVGAAVMSAYHTRLFLMGSKPVWAATLIALMFILFSATSFTASRYFFNMTGLTKLFGLTFLITGLAVVGFSMFSTVTVSYNQYVSAEVSSEEKQETVNTNRLLLEHNRKEQEDAQHEIDRYEKDIDYFRTRSWREAGKLQEILNTARQRLSSLRAEEAGLIRDTPRAVLEETTRRETVYTFVARIFQVSVDFVQFLVYVIPAVFFDLISPFALSVVLLLEDNRRKIMDIV